MQLIESQVNTSSLAEIFSSAFMDVSDVDAEGFRVRGDNIPIRVTLDTERKYIKFKFINIMKNINIAKASVITNQMNDEYFLVKFAAVEYQGDIYYTTEYVMNYKKNLVKFHLIDNLKMFEKITLAAGRDELGDYF